MKINPGWGPIGKNVKVNDNMAPPQAAVRNFGDVLKRQDEVTSKEQLSRLIHQINQQGDRLAKAMTVRELLQYKQFVKQFLEETARRGVVLKDTRGWDRRGRGKRYKILDEIDQELLAMADELLDTEQGRIELLQRVGEIRGMLVNLLF
ncbi:YaaR family protein [Paenibacillus sp. N1-5-1-14]|uniref:YaaR family protein n=1 Tax=Paenibacillus radicibacter TaxID=2972488 RepID=UPI002158FF17|nr:YaaR family protein [Paenibacillus radicibacter]MCR8645888.1 YaaR family protein [Paenibacillus radicibacter]